MLNIWHFNKLYHRRHRIPQFFYNSFNEDVFTLHYVTHISKETTRFFYLLIFFFVECNCPKARRLPDERSRVVNAICDAVGECRCPSSENGGEFTFTERGCVLGGTNHRKSYKQASEGNNYICKKNLILIGLRTGTCFT